MKKIEIWFSLGSTYTFLLIMRVRQQINKHNLVVDYRPFNLREVMTAMNNFPFSKEKKPKLKYMWRDIERRAQKYKIGKIKRNINFPIKNANIANKIAICAYKNNFLLQYLEETYRLWFFKNIEPGSLLSLKTTFKNLNKNLEEAIYLSKTKAIEKDYKKNTSLAIKTGVFGSPTFLIGKEIFFGDDRLEDAIIYAKNKLLI